MIKMFAIANCDTVKKARTFLEKNNVDYEFVDFKKVKPTKENIELWTKFFGELPVNKKGTSYRKFKEEYEALSDAKQVNFIIENSSMIKRPVIEKNGKVMAIGFQEEQYLKWIK